jgi:transcription antitermination factor NusG
MAQACLMQPAHDPACLLKQIMAPHRKVSYMLYPEMESWLAVQVAPQHEQTVGKLLVYRGFEQFLPTFKSKRRWSDRIKTVIQPLFPGYIFCRSSRSRTPGILAIRGVNKIVSFGGKLCAITDDEIARLREIVSCGMDPRPFPYLNAGQEVRIIREGPLFGIVGILKKVKNCVRLVVSVEMITKSISIEVDQRDVAPVNVSRTA